jgi:hypothetical protein
MNRGRVTVSIFVILVMTLVNGRIVNVREQIPDKFQLLARTESNHLHEFRLALKQKNIDILEVWRQAIVVLNFYTMINLFLVFFLWRITQSNIILKLLNYFILVHFAGSSKS